MLKFFNCFCDESWPLVSKSDTRLVPRRLPGLSGGLTPDYLCLQKVNNGFYLASGYTPCKLLCILKQIRPIQVKHVTVCCYDCEPCCGFQLAL